MAMAERTAMTAWDGDLAQGNGTVTGTSGALNGLAVTWASRTERSDGKTSPEELIAAAHSSCFSMALAHGLAEGGNPPEHLDVWPDDDHRSRIVFIGRGFTTEELERSLAAFNRAARP